MTTPRRLTPSTPSITPATPVISAILINEVTDPIIIDNERCFLRLNTPVTTSIGTPNITPPNINRDEQDVSFHFSRLRENEGQEKIEKKIESMQTMLIKQSKQIRALYELQKSTNEKVSWIQNQLKKQKSVKNNELSVKIFSVSINSIILR